MSTLSASDLQDAASAIASAASVVERAVTTLKSAGGPDKNQVLAYDVAHASAAVETARSMLDYGAKGSDEAALTCAFAADMVHDLLTRLIGREELWGVSIDDLAATKTFVAKFRDPTFLSSISLVQGPRHLDADFEMVQDTFRSFAMNEIASRDVSTGEAGDRLNP